MQVTDGTRSHNSLGTEEDPVRPYTEIARDKPLHDNSDKTQSSCFDLRVQGETTKNRSNVH